MNISDNLREKNKRRVLELFEKGHQNDDIYCINIRNDIQQKLLPYQVLHTFNMIVALKNNTVVVDGSYTGTGKTYTSIAVCAQLNMIPFVICPKSIMSTWKYVLNYFNIDYITVVNYETIRSSKYFDKNGTKVDCPFIKCREDGSFEWCFGNQTDKIVIIFDEVHKCKNYKTMNGKLLLSCRTIKTIMLSATLCDKSYDFGVFGMMLGFYKKYNQGKKWIESILREDRNQYSKNKINTLHKYLFPNKGSKMSLDDQGDLFPMNQISIDCYNLNHEQNIKINTCYENIRLYNFENKLTEILYIRQMIENIKVEIITYLIEDYYDQNRSVAVFVNFLSSHDMIKDFLVKKEIEYSEINGKQDDNERQYNIDKFQTNEVRVIICMIQAGGSSISLHDKSGRFPRVSIISPSYSRIELIQTLGRIYRNGVKSPCLQKIVYCAGTYEESIANILRSKKLVLDEITDNDMNIEKHIIPLRL